MPVSDNPNQSDPDVVYEVRLHEVRSSYTTVTHEMAKRWADGIKALLGVSSVVGLVAAPVALGEITRVGRAAIGLSLAAALLMATFALLLMMSVAYGSPRALPIPRSLDELAITKWELARRDRRQVTWGRRLAAFSLATLAVAIALAWTVPGADEVPRLAVRDVGGVEYCGPALDAPPGKIAVATTHEGRVEVPVDRIEAVAVVERCP